MSTSQFPVDHELLRALPRESAVIALSASGEAGDALLRSLLESQLDWGALVTLAARERAISPLFRRLSAVSDRVPANVFARLERLALVSEFQLSSLHDRLVKTVALLSAHGIDALLLKGAGLAYSVYGDPLERPMGDIDVLVRTEVAEEAWQLAVSGGWVRRSDVPIERSYADHQHLTPLEDADGLQMGLELHIALFTNQAPFIFPASQMWDSRRVVQLPGQRAYASRAEDQLVHAALHFAWSHEMTFGAWRTLRDADRLIASGTIDWPTFVERARAARGATCAYWTLRLSRDLVGAAVPSEVLEELRPRLPAVLLRKLTRYFAEHALPVAGVTSSSVSLSRALWTLGIRPKAQNHGRSRPWLDTEEWVRVPGGMRNAKNPAPSASGQTG